ncbi:antibiotic biosynthesis monooxygenase [Deinococcus sonorensis]|uniref:Antibiotic biosynthesis monooxygenase n=2 Tax=Deinococcus sonorensis TaxID=309891 RepID=A0AAU7U6G9_9DEIO
MTYIWATVHIEDLQKFIAVFSTAGAAARRKHGSRSCQLFTLPEADGQVRVLFSWESRAAFERFLNDTSTRATMQSSGTLGRPEFLFLDALAVLPG